MQRRLLLALALFIALCAADVDPCKRQPFRGRCPSVNGAPPSRSQFVLRYYLRNGECVSYPFGHCSQDDDEPKLFRYKEECEDACANAPSTTLVPPMDELQEQTYATVPPQEEQPEDKTYEKTQTECQRQRDSADGLIKGGFKPQCNDDGAFKTLQCEPDNETCFCVNPEGIEVANSRSKAGQPNPDCEKINSASQPRSNECVGGAESGPCSSSMARWFYDESEQKCKPFQYSGCGGNGNNYGSETACSKRCVPSIGAAKCHKGAEPLKTAHGAPVNCAKTECPSGYKCSVVQQSSVCCPDVEKSPIAGVLDSGVKADICQLPKERGPCDRYELRFHFDSNLKECKYFFFGGCDGNANNFERVEECEKACGHNGITKTAPVPPTTTAPRTSPTPSTTVEMITEITDVHVDENTATTVTETTPTASSGPQETTEEETEQTAVTTTQTDRPTEQETTEIKTTESHTTEPQTTETEPQTETSIASEAPVRPTASAAVSTSAPLPTNRCQHPKDLGSCGGQFVRWFWNSEAKMCETFAYSGCNGNGNNFASREECLGSCFTEVTSSTQAPPSAVDLSNVCDHAVDTGECSGVFQRFAFDRAFGDCRQFAYGGCGGNGNNFATIAECRSKCHKESTPAVLSTNPCDHAIEVGECSGVFGRFAYDLASNECRPFTYGGCGGNGNNFATIQECRQHCVKTRCAPEPQCDLTRCQLVNDAQGCPFCSCPPPRPSSTDNPLQRNLCPSIDLNLCVEPCIIFSNRKGCQECVCPVVTGSPGSPPSVVLPQPSPPVDVPLPVQPQPPQVPVVRPPAAQIHSAPAAPAPPAHVAPPAPAPQQTLVSRSPAPPAPQTVPQPPSPPSPPSPPRIEAPAPQVELPSPQGGNSELTQQMITRPEIVQPVPKAELGDKCTQPLDPGPCKNFVDRWHFNPVTGVCEQFQYGGCAGNRNHFFTHNECQIHCARFTRNRLAASTTAPEPSLLPAHVETRTESSTSTAPRTTVRGDRTSIEAQLSRFPAVPIPPRPETPQPPQVVVDTHRVVEQQQSVQPSQLRPIAHHVVQVPQQPLQVPPQGVQHQTVETSSQNARIAQNGENAQQSQFPQRPVIQEHIPLVPQQSLTPLQQPQTPHQAQIPQAPRQAFLPQQPSQNAVPPQQHQEFVIPQQPGGLQQPFRPQVQQIPQQNRQPVQQQRFVEQPSSQQNPQVPQEPQFVRVQQETSGHQIHVGQETQLRQQIPQQQRLVEQPTAQSPQNLHFSQIQQESRLVHGLQQSNQQVQVGEEARQIQQRPQQPVQQETSGHQIHIGQETQFRQQIPQQQRLVEQPTPQIPAQQHLQFSQIPQEPQKPQLINAPQQSTHVQQTTIGQIHVGEQTEFRQRAQQIAQQPLQERLVEQPIAQPPQRPQESQTSQKHPQPQLVPQQPIQQVHVAEQTEIRQHVQLIPQQPVQQRFVDESSPQLLPEQHLQVPQIPEEPQKPQLVHVPQQPTQQVRVGEEVHVQQRLVEQPTPRIPAQQHLQVPQIPEEPQKPHLVHVPQQPIQQVHVGEEVQIQQRPQQPVQQRLVEQPTPQIPAQQHLQVPQIPQQRIVEQPIAQLPQHLQVSQIPQEPRQPQIVPQQPIQQVNVAEQTEIRQQIPQQPALQQRFVEQSLHQQQRQQFVAPRQPTEQQQTFRPLVPQSVPQESIDVQQQLPAQPQNPDQRQLARPVQTPEPQQPPQVQHSQVSQQPEVTERRPQHRTQQPAIEESTTRAQVTERVEEEQIPTETQEPAQQSFQPLPQPGRSSEQEMPEQIPQEFMEVTRPRPQQPLPTRSQTVVTPLLEVATQPFDFSTSPQPTNSEAQAEFAANVAEETTETTESEETPTESTEAERTIDTATASAETEQSPTEAAETAATMPAVPQQAIRSSSQQPSRVQQPQSPRESVQPDPSSRVVVQRLPPPQLPTVQPSTQEARLRTQEVTRVVQQRVQTTHEEAAVPVTPEERTEATDAATHPPVRRVEITFGTEAVRKIETQTVAPRAPLTRPTVSTTEETNADADAVEVNGRYFTAKPKTASVTEETAETRPPSIAERIPKKESTIAVEAIAFAEKTQKANGDDKVRPIETLPVASLTPPSKIAGSVEDITATKDSVEIAIESRRSEAEKKPEVESQEDSAAESAIVNVANRFMSGQPQTSSSPPRTEPPRPTTVITESPTVRTQTTMQTTAVPTESRIVSSAKEGEFSSTSPGTTSRTTVTRTTVSRTAAPRTIDQVTTERSQHESSLESRSSESAETEAPREIETSSLSPVSAEISTEAPTEPATEAFTDAATTASEEESTEIAQSTEDATVHVVVSETTEVPTEVPTQVPTTSSMFTTTTTATATEPQTEAPAITESAELQETASTEENLASTEIDESTTPEQTTVPPTETVRPTASSTEAPTTTLRVVAPRLPTAVPVPPHSEFEPKLPAPQLKVREQKKKVHTTLAPEVTEFDDTCVMPPVSGPCNDYAPRWFFNSESGRCEQFSFGGCGGNTNNFADRAICEAKCVAASASINSQVPDRCTHDKDEGFGGGYDPKWYFNTKNLRCEMMVYQGAGGNDNQFSTLGDCQKSCTAVQGIGFGPKRPHTTVLPRSEDGNSNIVHTMRPLKEVTPPPFARGEKIATEDEYASELTTIPHVPIAENPYHPPTPVLAPETTPAAPAASVAPPAPIAPSAPAAPPAAPAAPAAPVAPKYQEPSVEEEQSNGSNEGSVEAPETNAPSEPKNSEEVAPPAPTSEEEATNAPESAPQPPSSEKGYGAEQLPKEQPKNALAGPILGPSPPATMDYVKGKRLDNSDNNKAFGISTNVLDKDLESSQSTDDKSTAQIGNDIESAEILNSPQCPNGVNALQYEDNRPVMCLPGKNNCPSDASCYFNGLDYFCCPNAEDPYDRHVFGGYNGEETRQGYKLKIQSIHGRRRARSAPSQQFSLDELTQPLRFDSKAPRQYSRATNAPRIGLNANPCVQDVDKGICREAHLRFFYDRNTDVCRLFYYSGCHGNANNFATLSECEQRCKIGIVPTTTAAPGACPNGDEPLGGSAPVLCGNQTDSIGCPLGYFCRMGPPDVCCPGAEPEKTSLNLEQLLNRKASPEVRFAPNIARAGAVGDEHEHHEHAHAHALIGPAHAHGAQTYGEDAGANAAPSAVQDNAATDAPAAAASSAAPVAAASSSSGLSSNSMSNICPDGSDALLEGGSPRSCGTGSDGHEFCPRGFYCSINIESQSRLCCAMGVHGSNIPAPPVIAPYFGRRLPNPGEVIDRGSLPSDPKPKPLSTPKPHTAAVEESEVAAGEYHETSVEAPAPLGSASGEQENAAAAVEEGEQSTNEYKGDVAAVAAASSVEHPDEIVVEEQPTPLASAGAAPMEQVSAANMPSHHGQENGPYGRMMLKPVNSHLKHQEKEIAQNEKLAASRVDAGIDVGSIDDPFDAIAVNGRVKLPRDRTICFLRPTEGRLCREDEPQPRTNLHYFYSVKDKKCKLFFHKGCGGNANRFEKKRDCEQLCTSVVNRS